MNASEQPLGPAWREFETARREFDRERQTQRGGRGAAPAGRAFDPLALHQEGRLEDALEALWWRRPMIPEEEVRRLVETVADAFTLAERGRAAEGYRLLLAAQQRADHAARAGEPWGESLGDDYEEWLDGFAARYGLAPSAPRAERRPREPLTHPGRERLRGERLPP